MVVGSMAWWLSARSEPVAESATTAAAVRADVRTPQAGAGTGEMP